MADMFPCYALNVVSDRETWAYYRGNFALVRLVDQRVTGYWETKVRGSHAVAVDGRRALLAGAYARRERDGTIVPGALDHQWLYLLTLDTGTVEVLEPRHIYGRRLVFDERRSMGRGTSLYLLSGRSVYRVDLADLPESGVPV